MEKIKECEYNEYAYKIAVDNSISTEDKLRLMIDEYNIKKTSRVSHFITQVNHIDNIKELKIYLEYLSEQMPTNTDIKGDTIVPTYKPGSNKKVRKK